MNNEEDDVNMEIERTVTAMRVDSLEETKRYPNIDGEDVEISHEVAV